MAPKIHREAGQATFVHECELRRHSLTVSWGAGYPALDLDSMPQVLLPGGQSQFCACGGDYERVEPCAGAVPHRFGELGERLQDGDHDCHPIAGHVDRSDDHTANLIESPEPDPTELEIARLRHRQWQIEQQQVIDFTAQLLEADEFPSEWARNDAHLTHLVARQLLEQDRAARA